MTEPFVHIVLQIPCRLSILGQETSPLKQALRAISNGVNIIKRQHIWKLAIFRYYFYGNDCATHLWENVFFNTFSFLQLTDWNFS